MDVETAELFFSLLALIAVGGAAVILLARSLHDRFGWARRADVWFRELGFVTLAFMALCGFLTILVLVSARPSSLEP